MSEMGKEKPIEEYRIENRKLLSEIERLRIQNSKIKEIAQGLASRVGCDCASIPLPKCWMCELKEELEALSAEEPKVDRTPPIVCLCGSTKFLDEEREIYFKETTQGKIVLSHSGRRIADKPTGGFLDQLHLRKIDLADEIFVLNIGGYIGESTEREIQYAKEKGKPIRYLEAQ